MKQKNSGFVAVLFAFGSILVAWLFSEHFTELVGMWKQARAKVNGADNAAPIEQPNIFKTNNESTE
jgi:hypothetical protein